MKNDKEIKFEFLRYTETNMVVLKSFVLIDNEIVKTTISVSKEIFERNNSSSFK